MSWIFKGKSVFLLNNKHSTSNSILNLKSKTHYNNETLLNLNECHGYLKVKVLFLLNNKHSTSNSILNLKSK
jgi:hypothetical protein